MTHLRWGDPPDAAARARVLKNEAKLRPLIPPVAAAEAAMWTAIADTGRMRGVREPNLEMCRITARTHQDAANKEAATGNAAAAIMILKDLGFRGFPEDAPAALCGLAKGQVTWPSDGSHSAPVAVQEELPPTLPPPLPQEQLPPPPTVSFDGGNDDGVSVTAVPWTHHAELHACKYTALRDASGSGG